MTWHSHTRGLPFLFLLTAGIAAAQDLPLGEIVPAVKCTADPQQSYALYLPSHYSRSRTWPVIFAFEPAARGRLPLEHYREAAEKYGYILAASNNSHNGPWEVGLTAARAM